jgi:predicted XRE-type DNA-binding protein
MLTQKQLIRTTEYWQEKIQNDLYQELMTYMKANNINRSELAKEWNVSKGYVSQVMNGNFNFTTQKLIELALHMEIAPVMDFKPISELEGYNMIVKPQNITAMPMESKTKVVSIRNRFVKKGQIPYELKVALAC